MTTVVTENLNLPDGSNPSTALVTVYLAGTDGVRVEGFNGVGTIVGDLHPAVARDGSWSAGLVANSTITPAGTAWRRIVQVDGRVVADDFLTVPTSGSWRVDQILTTAPASIFPPGAASIADLSSLTANAGARLTKLVAASDAPASVKTLADYVCDGTADNVEINQAMVAAGPGGTVQLSVGNFVVAAPVLINQHGLNLIGPSEWRGTLASSDTGQTAQLKLADGANTDVIQVSTRKNLIRDFFIHGNKAANTETPFTPTYVDMVTNGTTTVTSATAGFNPNDVGKSVTGTNIPGGTTIASVTNSTTAILSAAATGSGAGGSLSITSRFTVGHGISYTKYDTSADLHIERCYIFFASGNGIEIGASQCTVINTYPENNQGYGVHLAGGAGTFKMTRGTVAANTKAGICDESIGFVGASSIGNNSFIGVEISSGTAEGVVFSRGYGKTLIGCTIAHNSKEGVKIVGDAAGVLIGNCQLYDCSRGTNNTYSCVTFAQDPVSLTWPASAVVANNRMYSHASSKPKYGIEEQGASTGPHVVTGNVISDTVTAPILRQNPATIVRGNPGYVSEAYGATSVADGGTITHGLAAAPTRVTATPSVAGEFVSVTALSSTTFTVAIRKHDGTAGTTQTVYWRADL